MSHLVLVTLGPVQDFIAQARRTRDLWFGSHLLSEIARAAAAALAQQHQARLIFPALERDGEELRPSPGPLRPSGVPALAVPNKILCEVGEDPESAADAAMRAAEARWIELAASVRRECRNLLADTDQTREAWDEQIDTFLELAAAWTALPDRARYKAAREALERELAGRKLLRDFPAWHRQRGTVPKSSLDGARETVLAEPKDRSPHLVRRYRIHRNEQLDAVGLVKRAGGDPDQFVPIANVALAHWMAAARQRSRRNFDEMKRICERSGFKPVRRADLQCGERLLPWDAEVFLKDRWGAMLEEAAGEDEEAVGAPAAATARQPRSSAPRLRPSDRVARWEHRERAQQILDRMSPPFPYVVCLVADGDRMGRALDAISDPEQHHAFSAQLSEFAERARKIVEQDHRGILVYAGGDDVLAFINVAEAPRCADEMRMAFSQLAQQALASAAPDSPVPTLSVGLGIGHLLESMGQLRRLGRDAEQLAKTRRNALGVVVDRRSGGRTSLCESWEDDPVPRLESAVSLLQNRQLSMKKVHEIGAELSRMPPPESLLDVEQAAWADLLRGEAERILSRSWDGDGLSAAEVGLALRPEAGYTAQRDELERWLSRMLVARVLVEANRSARPAPPREGSYP